MVSGLLLSQWDTTPSLTVVEPLIAVQSVRVAVSESANTTVRVDGVSKQYDSAGR